MNITFISTKLMMDSFFKYKSVERYILCYTWLIPSSLGREGAQTKLSDVIYKIKFDKIYLNIYKHRKKLK